MMDVSPHVITELIRMRVLSEGQCGWQTIHASRELLRELAGVSDETSRREVQEAVSSFATTWCVNRTLELVCIL